MKENFILQTSLGLPSGEREANDVCGGLIALLRAYSLQFIIYNIIVSCLRCIESPF